MDRGGGQAPISRERMAQRVKLLAIDTSSQACSVAIMDGDNVTAVHKIAPMQQTNLILPMIQDLLDSSSLNLNQLDAIAYGCGPGSFTGIRIASSVAQGLGYGANLPVIPVSSLAATAQAAFLEKQWRRLLVSIDARMKLIYWAAYEVSLDGCVELVGEEQACEPELIVAPESGDWSGVGDGWTVYGDRLVDRLGYAPIEINPSQLPTAEALLALAKVKFDRGEWVAASAAIPVYLR